ncbi:MAG: transglycosylase domain-containing protein [Clostridia bacterium]|nr:transglycosylase domain-containing protein [Clostridia bacterium]
MPNEKTQKPKKRSFSAPQSPMFKPRTKERNFVLEVIMTTAKLFFVVALLVGVALTGLVVGAAKAWVETMPSLDISAFDEQAQTSYIYDKNGDLITDFKGYENRVEVDYDELPEYLVKAVVAVEDQRFWEHNGIDVRRLAGVIVGSLTNSESLQGGSTITQQLIKNTILSSEQTIKRKIQEIYLAIELEQQISKQEILAEYLNVVYMGGSNYGVKVAAQDYFGKELKDLTLRECAALARVVRNPGKYNPRANYYTRNMPQTIEDGCDYVLKQMYEQGLINKSEYNQALVERLNVIQYAANSNTEVLDNLYYVEYAIYDVVTKMLRVENLEDNRTNRSRMETKLRTGGYRIYTALDPGLQDSVQRVVTNWDMYPRMRSSADNVYRASLGNGEYLEKVQPQAAVTIIDWRTGELQAIVGGRSTPTGWKQTHLAYGKTNMPVGSSLKPLSVYGPALDLGNSPGSPVLNLPIQIAGWDSETGYPTNYEGGGYSGVETLRVAINRSHNTAAAQALMTYVGIENSIEYLKRLGITTATPTGSGLALGTSGISTIEMAAGFAAVANGGVYLEPVAFSKVCRSDGSVYIDAYDEQITRRAFRESTAWMLVDMLIGCCSMNVEGSTGKQANFGGFTVAGKTGTNSDYRGVFFTGMTGYLAGAVWIGSEDYKPLVTGASGGSYAAPLWAAIMERAHQYLGYTVDQPIRTHSAAELGLFQVEVCGVSGMAPTDACRQDINNYPTNTDYFASGTEPVLACNMHRMVRLCTISKRLPTSSCRSTAYYGVIYLPEGHPLRSGVSTVVQEYFPGASTAKDAASMSTCTVCSNNESDTYSYANRYLRRARFLLENRTDLTEEQIERIEVTIERLNAAMINMDTEAVREYTQLLRSYYYAIVDED